MVKKGVNKMAKVDIISGFLGAGKTTLIKKLLNESLKDEKLVLIENEFGEIGIDGGFMRDFWIQRSRCQLHDSKIQWRVAKPCLCTQ